MLNEDHILLSLAPRHAESILAGRKRVELRRRMMHVTPGTTIWIYAKCPIGSIVGRVKIVAVHASSPSSLWKQFGNTSGLSRKEFFEYFSGVSRGVALALAEAETLKHSFSLAALRTFAEGFQPPQFFTRLGTQHPLFSVVSTVR